MLCSKQTIVLSWCQVIRNCLCLSACTGGGSRDQQPGKPRLPAEPCCSKGPGVRPLVVRSNQGTVAACYQVQQQQQILNGRRTVESSSSSSIVSRGMVWEVCCKHTAASILPGGGQHCLLLHWQLLACTCATAVFFVCRQCSMAFK
jgi:hypothetical protein